MATQVFCGAVQADAISSDIVGYTSQTLNDGFTTSVGTFVGVGAATDTMPISSLAATATGLASEGIAIQTLDEFGATAKIYLYITESDAVDYGLEGAGWIDMDEYYGPAEKTFTAGEGFLVQNAYADGGITCSGAVAKGATEVVLNDGFTTSGNLNPESVNIQSIVATATGLASEGIAIQTLDEFGATAKIYLYITESDAVDYGLEGAGWIDMDEYYGPAEKTFTAGEGFLIQNAYADGAVTLPAVVVE